MKHRSCPPELKLTAIFFGLVIFLCGCSSSFSVSSTGMPDAEYSYREMNDELKGRLAKIELKDGKNISAKEVKISGDSVWWFDRETDKASRADIGQLKTIVVKKRFLGFLEGLEFGLVGGGGLGALIGNSLDDGGGDFGSGFGAAVGLILGGGIGIFVGSITGGVIGHRYNYEFPMTERSDSLQNKNLYKE